MNTFTKSDAVEEMEYLIEVLSTNLSPSNPNSVGVTNPLDSNVIELKGDILGIFRIPKTEANTKGINSGKSVLVARDITFASDLPADKMAHEVISILKNELGLSTNAVILPLNEYINASITRVHMQYKWSIPGTTMNILVAVKESDEIFGLFNLYVATFCDIPNDVKESGNE